MVFRSEVGKQVGNIRQSQSFCRIRGLGARQIVQNIAYVLISQVPVGIDRRRYIQFQFSLYTFDMYLFRIHISGCHMLFHQFYHIAHLHIKAIHFKLQSRQSEYIVFIYQEAQIEVVAFFRFQSGSRKGNDTIAEQLLRIGESYRPLVRYLQVKPSERFVLHCLYPADLRCRIALFLRSLDHLV